MAAKNKERSLNPVLAMRKNQRKKEIKKTKQTRIQQRTATLKQKDVHELIVEMENLDRLELESIKKGYFNENTLREKKHKLRQTIIQMISLYEKENKTKAKEIKSLLSTYDLQKNSSSTHANSNVEDVIIPSKEDDTPSSSTKDEIKKLLPNIPLPGSTSVMAAAATTFPSINITSKKEDNKPPLIDLNNINMPLTNESLNETFPTVAWLPAHLNPPLPPPCVPPTDAPALPDYLKNTVYHGPIPSVFFPPPSNVIAINNNNNPPKIPIIITTPPTQSRKLFVQKIDANANYTAESTLCAKPVLKDLQAEIIKLVPTTLQVKRNKPPTTVSTSNNSSNSIPKKKEKILENFMREINNL